MGDSALTYTGTGGRDPYSEFAVSLDGKRTRLARRNSSSPPVVLPHGESLFSQMELTSPSSERSDLFVQRGNRQVRLTKNARLFSPDARSDGAIIATQIVKGTSRLVRVFPDAGQTMPITAASFDTLWSEPRWSQAGDRIVAVRWCRGGVAQSVVIDTLGSVLHVATSARFTAGAPSWIPGDIGIAYPLGDNARHDVYLQYFYDSLDARTVDSRGTFPGAAYRTLTYKVGRSDFGAFEPQLARDRASERLRMAVVALRGNGYRLEVGGLPAPRAVDVAQRPMLDLTPDPRLPALASDSSLATNYSALRTLAPRFWVPVVQIGTGGNPSRFGGYTEGWDILRRHYVYGELLIPVGNDGIDAVAQYQYKGFGLPIVTVDATQDRPPYPTIGSKATPTRTLAPIPRPIRNC